MELEQHVASAALHEQPAGAAELEAGVSQCAFRNGVRPEPLQSVAAGRLSGPCMQCHACNYDE